MNIPEKFPDHGIFPRSLDSIMHTEGVHKNFVHLVVTTLIEQSV